MLKEQNTFIHENKSSRRDKTIQRTTSIFKPIMKQTPQQIIQRVSKNPDSLTHADAMVLQRAIGNRAVNQLLLESHSKQIDKPAQVGAVAYTQGTDIHVASGQEKHLPHEAWHVVQQKQGRVQPTMQMKGVGVNDDVELEREADDIEKKALQRKTSLIGEKITNINTGGSSYRNISVIQCMDDGDKRPMPPSMAFNGQLEDIAEEPNRDEVLKDASSNIHIVVNQIYRDGNHRFTLREIYRTLAQQGFILHLKPFDLYAKVHYLRWQELKSDIPALAEKLKDFINNKIVFERSGRKRALWLRKMIENIEALPDTLSEMFKFASEYDLGNPKSDKKDKVHSIPIGEKQKYKTMKLRYRRYQRIYRDGNV